MEALARAIVNEIAGEEQPGAAGEDQLEAARALAAAQLELKRSARPRWRQRLPDPDQLLDPQALTHLWAIGRYERLAQSLRKAAKRRLDEIVGGDGFG